MAIDYEFREKIDRDFREVSRFLLSYFNKNPDRAKENRNFIGRLQSVLDNDPKLNFSYYANHKKC